MKNLIKNLVKRIVRYCLSEEIEKLESQIDRAKKAQKTFEDVLSNFDCSVDVHTERHSPSWAVISLQGQKSDYLKFIDLGNSEIREIASFLRQFERRNKIKIDADPSAFYFLKETLKF